MGTTSGDSVRPRKRLKASESPKIQLTPSVGEWGAESASDSDDVGHHLDQFELGTIDASALPPSSLVHQIAPVMDPSTGCPGDFWTYPLTTTVVQVSGPGVQLTLRPSLPAVPAGNATARHPLPHPTLGSSAGSSAFVPVNSKPATIIDRDKRRRLEGLTNPCEDNAQDWIPSLPVSIMPPNGIVNGYIKVHFRRTSSRGLQANEYRQKAVVGHPASLGVSSQLAAPADLLYPDPRSALVAQPSNLPPDFGRQMKLKGDDRKLFEFYRGPWCLGRTLLDDGNYWYHDVLPMAASNELVRRLVLALGGKYVLDYNPLEELRKRTNDHYAKAVAYLSGMLSDEEKLEGEANAVVAGIGLLDMLDVVFFEARRPKGRIPRWLELARLANRILEFTDVGFRYWHTENVQCERARLGNSIMAGRREILAFPLMPLDLANTENSEQRRFRWLIQGTKEDQTRIHAVCGFCPQLLHAFADITHWATLMSIDCPDSPYYDRWRREMRNRLRNLRQWFVISETGERFDGYLETNQLLASCTFDDDDHVQTKAEMTHLTAEAWRLAATIYFYCRVMRLPRAHVHVQSTLSHLSRCIRHMPTSNGLFTAQAPFLPVSLLYLLAVSPTDFRVAEGWFDSVLKEARVRSSVSPVQKPLQELRVWIDANIEDDLVLADEIEHRQPWWENMVNRVREEYGILCLV